MSIAIPMNPPVEVEQVVENVTISEKEMITGNDIKKCFDIVDLPEWIINIYISSLLFPSLIYDETGKPVEVVAIENVKLYRGKIKEITISYNKENQEKKSYTFNLKNNVKQTTNK
jgi:hypothetical protein